MDEETKTQEGAGENTALYYGIGAAVLILLVVGVYFLRPKSAGPSTPQLSQSGATGASLVRPTDPIKGFACEIQYYNPVIGFPQYYLSAEGVDVTTATSASCDFTVSVGGAEVSKSTSRAAVLTDDATRGGKNFRCITDPVEVTPDVETVVDVLVTNDRNQTSTCSGSFFFPAP